VIVMTASASELKDEIAHLRDLDLRSLRHDGRRYSAARPPITCLAICSTAWSPIACRPNGWAISTGTHSASSTGSLREPAMKMNSRRRATTPAVSSRESSWCVLDAGDKFTNTGQYNAIDFANGGDIRGLIRAVDA
jgi:hypothetical protein